MSDLKKTNLQKTFMAKSPRAAETTAMFLDPNDGKPRVELLLMEPEALQWAWRYIGLFGKKAQDDIFDASPSKELGQLTVDAALFTDDFWGLWDEKTFEDLVNCSLAYRPLRSLKNQTLLHEVSQRTNP